MVMEAEGLPIKISSFALSWIVKFSLSHFYQAHQSAPVRRGSCNHRSCSALAAGQAAHSSRSSKVTGKGCFTEFAVT